MEYSLINIFYVVVVLVVIYYIGYIKGFTKKQILDNQETDYHYDIAEDIDYGFEDQEATEIARKFEHVVQVRIEKIYDSFYVYEEETHMFLTNGNDLTEISERLVKIGGNNTLYWFPNEMLELFEESK